MCRRGVRPSVRGSAQPPQSKAEERGTTKLSTHKLSDDIFGGAEGGAEKKRRRREPGGGSLSFPLPRSRSPRGRKSLVLFVFFSFSGSRFFARGVRTPTRRREGGREHPKGASHGGGGGRGGGHSRIVVAPSSSSPQTSPPINDQEEEILIKSAGSRISSCRKNVACCPVPFLSTLPTFSHPEFLESLSRFSRWTTTTFSFGHLVPLVGPPSLISLDPTVPRWLPSVPDNHYPPRSLPGRIARGPVSTLCPEILMPAKPVASIEGGWGRTNGRTDGQGDPQKVICRSEAALLGMTGRRPHKKAPLLF